MGKRTVGTAMELQLIGLLTLADHYNRALKDIERTAGELLDWPNEGDDYFGNLSDAVYGTGDPVARAREAIRLLPKARERHERT